VWQSMIQDSMCLVDHDGHILQCVAACVAVCCSVLQCVAVCSRV